MPRSPTGMQPRVLLDVRQLLELAITVGTFVGLLAGVDADVLDQLWEGDSKCEVRLGKFGTRNRLQRS